MRSQQKPQMNIHYTKCIKTQRKIAKRAKMIVNKS